MSSTAAYYASHCWGKGYATEAAIAVIGHGLGPVGLATIMAVVVPRRHAAAHRRSYARRTSSERTFATIKDPATTTIARGWCQLTGLTPLALWIACLHAARNQRILTTWNIRQTDNNKRAAGGLPPRTRKRRRRATLASLTTTP